ncbi:MAG: hypothetical protein RLZZ618_2513 [Pseudomonadota bacterium]
MIESAAGGRERQVWGVAALVHAVAETLASRFSAVTVRGELSGFQRAASGHCYLSLKDTDGGNALMRCAMFRRTASLLDFTPADGQLVEVRGRVAVYEPRGDLQFVVEAMRPAGAGALFEQFLKLRAKLDAEGLFDPDRKQALPSFPLRVGVVTSLGAAALHDVLTALARRSPHVRVVVYPSLVQGSEAPAALVRAIGQAESRNEVDVLLVCRGGGSLEDLWSFNDERVVRAIAACRLPVVVGVGHETDITLSDLAADLRAPTPTAAAELAVPTRRECLELLMGFETLMSNRIHRTLDAQAQRLDRATLRLRRPADGLRRHAQQLSALQQRLSSATRQTVRSDVQHQAQLRARLQRAQHVQRTLHQQRLMGLSARLDGLDPRRVLARGYAWLTDAEGRPVASVVGLEAGQQVHAVLADGEVHATIDTVATTPPATS